MQLLLLDIEFVAIGMTLIIQSYWDLRYKEIPLLVTVISGAIGITLSILSHRTWMDMLYALIPGIACIGIGKITRQAIGYGDGFLLCAMGLYISCEEILGIGMMAITVSGIVALFCLALCKKKGKDQLPFVPFLLMGWILYLLVGKGF